MLLTTAQMWILRRRRPWHREARSRQDVGLDEDLIRRDAVDMHLLDRMVAGPGLDHHGREHRRNAGRGHQHIAEQGQRIGPAAGRDGAHVPDDGTLGVEVGGDHEEAPTGPMLGRDPVQETGGRVGVDHGAQRRRIHQAVAGEDLERVLGRPDAGRAIARVEFRHDGILGRPEEREGGDQRTRAHAAHHVEDRAMSRSGSSRRAGRPRTLRRPRLRRARGSSRHGWRWA